MGYTIRQMSAEHNVCQELSIEALHRAVPPRRSAPCGASSRRGRGTCALSAGVTIWALIAMDRYTHLALRHVLRKVSQGLRFIWPDPTCRVPGASACV